MMKKSILAFLLLTSSAAALALSLIHISERTAGDYRQPF